MRLVTSCSVIRRRMSSDIGPKRLRIDQRHPDTDELSLGLLPGHILNPSAGNGDASERTPTRSLAGSLYKVGVR